MIFHTKIPLRNQCNVLLPVFRLLRSLPPLFVGTRFRSSVLDSSEVTATSSNQFVYLRYELDYLQVSVVGLVTTRQRPRTAKELTICICRLKFCVLSAMHQPRSAPASCLGDMHAGLVAANLTDVYSQSSCRPVNRRLNHLGHRAARSTRALFC